MTSRIAQEDAEQLEEEGIKLTFPEWTRLNAFGLKVERDTQATDLYALPRVAIIGEVSFREPTLGSEIWFNEASRLFNMDNPDTYLILRAYSLSMPQNELPDSGNQQVIMEGMKALVEKLKDKTMTSIADALLYTVEGNKPHDAEPKAHDRKKDDEEEEMFDAENSCFEIGVLNNGILYSLGGVNELKGMTTSRLLALVQYKKMMKFGSMKKESEARALGEYYAVLEEIKENHKNEVKDNG